MPLASKEILSMCVGCTTFDLTIFMELTGLSRKSTNLSPLVVLSVVVIVQYDYKVSIIYCILLHIGTCDLFIN